MDGSPRPSSPYRVNAWRQKDLMSELRNRKLTLAQGREAMIRKLELDDMRRRGIPVNYADWRLKELQGEVYARGYPHSIVRLRKAELVRLLSEFDERGDTDITEAVLAALAARDAEDASDSDAGDNEGNADAVYATEAAPKVAEADGALPPERHSLLVWPFAYIGYLLRWWIEVAHDITTFFAQHIALFVILVGAVAAFAAAVVLDTDRRDFYLDLVRWYGVWIVLGFSSSAGLGFGAHTFVLALGPFIVQTMVAADLCDGKLSVVHGEIMQRGYRHVCDTTQPEAGAFMDHMQLVWLEAFLWGLGTAIGELPPYFFARSAAATGASVDGIESIGRFLDPNAPPPADLPSRIVYALVRLMRSFGFIGVLLMASFPNPLFDMAGLLAGYTLMPFWKFFGATMIGKAIIKATVLQTGFLVAVSQKHIVNAVLEWLPPDMHAAALSYMDQLRQFDGADKPKSALSYAFDLVIAVVIVGFSVSIINNMVKAQRRHEHERRVRRAA